MFGPISDCRGAHDVMVTGIGMVTPLGIGRESTWSALLAGRKAGRVLLADQIDHFQQLTDLLKRQPTGAPVNHQQVEDQLRQTLLKTESSIEGPSFQKTWGQDCLNNMVAVCLVEALTDAGLELTDVKRDRIGCVVGTSKASLRAMETALRTGTQQSNHETASNLWHSGFMPDAPLQTILALTRAAGPASCPVAACATGLFSVLEGAAMIQSGLCDICIVGSADASLRSSVLAGFHRLGVTSRNEDAASACRPFDQHRDGFIVGEGGAIMILESRRHQEARNATAYAQLTDGISLTDPTGMTQIDGSGRVVAQLLRQLNCPEADFISLHGTGTETNDLAEARGVAAVYAQRPPLCFGTKGATGHLLGAAASVEFGLTCLALKNSAVPGTANHSVADSECPITLSSQSIDLPAATSAVKLSLGFGGHVVGCVVRKP